MYYKRISSAILFILILVGLEMKAQNNFVPNHSFENLDSLPCSFIGSQYWFDFYIVNWTMPTDGSSDLYSTLSSNTCYAYPLSGSGGTPGIQNPRSGFNMAGIYTWGTGGQPSGPNYREYLQVHLNQPLTIGQTYYAEFYCSLADSKIGANNLGMYFSSVAIDSTYERNLNFTPDILDTSVISDYSGWHKVSGNFTASTNAQYLIIGNFFTDNNTNTDIPWVNQSYYFIDDVCVSNDSLGCMIITSTPEYSPTSELIIYPNPTRKNWKITTENSAIEQLIIYNSMGKMMLNEINLSKTIEINTTSYETGMYVIQTTIQGQTHYYKAFIID
ncbi:MAG: T9SS type A sorting domain-containing protein [Flavobacteriales bacterium]|nr:T9SS type A sorting domain-containing protein [Flavobacteriales bacterium]